MYKYWTALALVLALAVWNYYPYLYPTEPTPPPVAVKPVPAPKPVDESSPSYIGTIKVNGIEVRIFEPHAPPPLAPLAPSTVAHPQFRIRTWMNGHSAWAGLTSMLIGPIAAVTGVMLLWLLLASGRRLFYRNV